MKSQEKTKYEITKNKEEDAGPKELKTEEVDERTEGNGGEYEKQARNPKSHRYCAMCDGDQALISPFPSRHVEIATVAGRITVLAHAIHTQGLGGN